MDGDSWRREAVRARGRVRIDVEGVRLGQSRRWARGRGLRARSSARVRARVGSGVGGRGLHHSGAGSNLGSTNSSGRESWRREEEIEVKQRRGVPSRAGRGLGFSAGGSQGGEMAVVRVVVVVVVVLDGVVVTEKSGEVEAGRREESWGPRCRIPEQNDVPGQI